MKRRILKKGMSVIVAVSMLSIGMVANAQGSYTVKEGDYLKKIAKEVYGNISEWETIYNANKDIIKNPNLIYKGQVLTIPGESEAVITPTEETVSETGAEGATPAQPEAAAGTSAKNVPVGTNPVPGNGVEQWLDMYGYIIETSGRSEHLVEATDQYGIIYQEHYEGGNQWAMEMVANYIQSNPSFVDVAKENNLVIVSSSFTSSSDGEYWMYTPYQVGVIDCEPEDCLYFFAHSDMQGDAWSWTEALDWLVSAYKKA